jgi:hypothetical protein
MSVSGVFFDAEFEYVSRISLSPTRFALRQTVTAHVSQWGPVGGSLDMI